MRGFSTFTSNVGRPEVFDTTVGVGLDRNQTTPATLMSKARAMMSSEIFLIVVMPRMITADRGGGQTIADCRLPIANCQFPILRSQEGRFTPAD